MSNINASTQLNKLFVSHWESWLRWDPLFATQCGDHNYDNILPSADENHYLTWQEQLKSFQKQQSTIQRNELSSSDQLNYDIFARLLELEISELGYCSYYLPLSKIGGFHIFLPDLYLYTSFETITDYENYIARLEAIQNYFQEYIELMRLGLSNGFLPSQPVLDGINESIQPHIVAEPADSSFYKPFEKFPSEIKGMEQERLTKAARVAILGSVVPAYKALLKFINQEYRPAARSGISASDLPNGDAFYLNRIVYFTTLNLTHEAVHDKGYSEVRRIRKEMESTIQKIGFLGNFQEFIEFLRKEQRFYAKTSDALLKESAYILKRIDGELPRLFKTLPRLPYGIRPMPDFSAPGNTTAEYQPGTGDGTRAGMYYVNTYDLKSRPLYEIEALSLHEAVPGHHLQHALQQELDLPNFRRFGGFTAFEEGWALYAERLGLEIGFYEDAYSDFGRLSYEMWRACRLVVDTGIHAMGWTRQQAIEFMADNTALTMRNITNEIDRYIAWPGQALAYKVGEIKIRELRAQAENELGKSFNIREFHDVVLRDGSVPLDILENKVKKWILTQKTK